MSGDTFNSIFNREFRWPKAGDRPFTESPHWEDNAYIDQRVEGRLVLMTIGYKKAGDLMVERATQDRKHTKNASRCVSQIWERTSHGEIHIKRRSGSNLIYECQRVTALQDERVHQFIVGK
jgi:hypothetical protein